MKSNIVKKKNVVDHSHSDVVAKWGLLVAERGFTQIPTYLLNINRFLNKEHQLSPIEQLVVFHIVSNWWDVTTLPYPAISTLAHRCGVSTRQVQRAINRLDELDIVKRVKRQRGKLAVSNAYDLTKLVDLLNQIAKEYPNEYPRKVSGYVRKKISDGMTK